MPHQKQWRYFAISCIILVLGIIPSQTSVDIESWSWDIVSSNLQGWNSYGMAIISSFNKCPSSANRCIRFEAKNASIIRYSNDIDTTNKMNIRVTADLSVWKSDGVTFWFTVHVKCNNINTLLMTSDLSTPLVTNEPSKFYDYNLNQNYQYLPTECENNAGINIIIQRHGDPSLHSLVQQYPSSNLDLEFMMINNLKLYGDYIIVPPNLISDIASWSWDIVSSNLQEWTSYGMAIITSFNKCPSSANRCIRFDAKNASIIRFSNDIDTRNTMNIRVTADLSVWKSDGVTFWFTVHVKCNNINTLLMTSNLSTPLVTNEPSKFYDYNLNQNYQYLPTECENNTGINIIIQRHGDPSLHSLVQQYPSSNLDLEFMMMNNLKLYGEYIIVPPTSNPTQAPVPTTAEPTKYPTQNPTTSTSTNYPTTATPTNYPSTSIPTENPITSKPTGYPTLNPTTSAPTPDPNDIASWSWDIPSSNLQGWDSYGMAIITSFNKCPSSASRCIRFDAKNASIIRYLNDIDTTNKMNIGVTADLSVWKSDGVTFWFTVHVKCNNINTLLMTSNLSTPLVTNEPSKFYNYNLNQNYQYLPTECENNAGINIIIQRHGDPSLHSLVQQFPSSNLNLEFMMMNNLKLYGEYIIVPPTSDPTQAPVPTTAEPTKYPTRNPTASTSTNYPTTATPTNYPSTSIPSNYPTTATPSNYSSTSTATNYPTTSMPTNYATTVTPSNYPTTSIPTNYPPTSIPTNYPTTATPSNHPTTSTPSNYPTTSKPTGYPTQNPATSAPTPTPTSNPILKVDEGDNANYVRIAFVTMFGCFVLVFAC